MTRRTIGDKENHCGGDGGVDEQDSPCLVDDGGSGKKPKKKPGKGGNKADLGPLTPPDYYPDGGAADGDASQGDAGEKCDGGEGGADGGADDAYVVTCDEPGAACDDEDLCTYGDVCGEDHVCRGTEITCESDPGDCGYERACNGTESCEETPKQPFEGIWLFSAWGDCQPKAGGCGLQGVRTREVACLYGCCDPATEPPALEDCTLTVPFYTDTWISGDWSACAPAGCGATTGTQTRSVSCTGSCCDPAQQPPATQGCNLGAAYYPDAWAAAPWGACQAPRCETAGVMHRAVSCQGACCDPAAAPPTQASCVSGACVCMARMYIDSHGDGFDGLKNHTGLLPDCINDCARNCRGWCGNHGVGQAKGKCYKGYLGGGDGTVYLDQSCNPHGRSLPPWGKECGYVQVRLE